MYYLRTVRVPEAPHVGQYHSKRGALMAVALFRAANTPTIELYDRDPDKHPLAFDMLPAMAEEVRGKLLGRQMRSVMSRRARVEAP